MPYQLSFGDECRLPSESLVRVTPPDKTLALYPWAKYITLEDAFSFAREDLAKAQKHAKDRYAIVVTPRIFRLGDRMPVRLNTLARPGNKLLSRQCTIYQVASVDGPVLDVHDVKTKST